MYTTKTYIELKLCIHLKGKVLSLPGIVKQDPVLPDDKPIPPPPPRTKSAIFDDEEKSKVK